MALRKTYNGKTIYVRVDRAIVGKFVQVPDLIVGIYDETEAQPEATEDNPSPQPVKELKQQTTMHFYFKDGTPEFSLFTPEALSPEGMNPLKRAYEYLKSLPQFADYDDA